MTIREVIIESGRWNCISEIIGKILEVKTPYEPVNIRYEENGTATNYVSMKNVRKGIARWLMFIDMEDTVCIPNSQRELLDDFSRLIESMSEMELHNYAVKCSHGINPTEESMEHIRALCVLSLSIDYILYNLDTDDTDERDFIPLEIPSGWKKQ